MTEDFECISAQYFLLGNEIWLVELRVVGPQRRSWDNYTFFLALVLTLYNSLDNNIISINFASPAPLREKT